MLAGSGFIANALAPLYSKSEDVCFYAAGVSNSSCTDELEFAREQSHLLKTLEQTKDFKTFIYFGTCSVDDPDLNKTPYVQHKIAMEKLVRTHPSHLILRLPQIAGHSDNPYTLLNFLHTRILRGEAFQLWQKAERNIIDIDDIVAIVEYLVKKESVRNVTLNIATPNNHFVTDIVSVMEKITKKEATYSTTKKGSPYSIDTSMIEAMLEEMAIDFKSDYLERVLTKYYGSKKA